MTTTIDRRLTPAPFALRATTPAVRPAPLTRAPLDSFQRSPLLARPSVDGATLARAYAAQTPATSAAEHEQELRDAVLAAAEAEVGTKEKGNNGGDVTKYPEYFGRGAEKYCADFVSYILSASGVPFDQFNCQTITDTGVANGTFKESDPKPGDLVLFDFDGDGTADHVGIVKAVNDDGTITTIEGNTSNPDGAGEGVYEKTRNTDHVVGYVDPY